MHEDGVVLERAREAVGRRGPDARALELDALAAVEVAHPGHDHARRIDRGVVAEPRVPAPAGGGEAHAAEEAADRRVGGVEVAVGVEPEDPRLRHVAEDGRQRRHADRAVGREQHRAQPRGQRVVDLAAGLEQAAARLAQVVLVARRSRLAGRADQPRLDPEQPPEPRRQRVDAAHPSGRAIRCPAAQRDDRRVHRPVHTGSRFSKKALTPSWMSSVAKAIASCARR